MTHLLQPDEDSLLQMLGGNSQNSNGKNTKKDAAPSSSSSSSSSDGDDDSSESDVDFRETERFKVWRKHTRDVYKTCMHFEPSWPCRTIQFLPFMTVGTGQAPDLGNANNSNNNTSSNNNNNAGGGGGANHHNNNNNSSNNGSNRVDHQHLKQTLLAGSTTGGTEQSYLKLLTLDLPGGAGNRPPPGTDELDKESGDVGGYGFAPRYVDFSVAARFFHDGDVLCARYMPSNPNVYLTSSSNGNCYLFDYGTIRMMASPNFPKRPRLPPVPVLTPGHQMRYEKEQGMYRIENKKQEIWDKDTRGEGQHKVVLRPGSDILKNNSPFQYQQQQQENATSAVGQDGAPSSSVPTASSCEFNVFDHSGVVAAGYSNGAIALWNLSDPVPLASSSSGQQQQQQSNASTSGNLKKPATSAQQKIDLEPKCVRWCPKGVTQVGFSYVDPNVLGSSSLDGIARIWDLRENGNNNNNNNSAQISFTCSSSSDKSPAPGGATSFAWSIFESNKIAVGYSDGLIRIWDSRNNRAPIMACANHQKSAKDVTCLQWNPHDKNVLASGGEDGNVVWVNLAKQEVMFVHFGHPSAVNDLCWSWQDAFAGLMVSVDDHGIIAWCPRANLLG